MTDPVISFLSDLFSQYHGQIPFELFMHEALYHPDLGYYNANISGIGGQRSDFTTAPELSTLLASTIAIWLMEEASRPSFLQNSKTLHIIEVGCGDGSMAHGILQSWNWWQRRKIRYHLIESSPVLSRRQQEKLKEYRHHCHWHSDIRRALSEANACALILSNELIDAFPVTALRWNGTEKQWQEICLAFSQEAGLREIFVPLEKNRLAELKRRHSIFQDGPQKEIPHGARRELHSSARVWLEGWIDQWQHGALLTIDYGDHVSPLYHRRPEGSLRAYYQHQRLTGSALYQRFGKQDLTADVNFTDLENWGAHFGLDLIRFESLRDFTQRHQSQGQKKLKPHAFDHSSFVTEPGGSGDAFKTLLQRKS